MSTVYPGAVDSFTVPAAGVPLGQAAPVTQRQLAQNQCDSLTAIETELGVNPRAGYADVKARLDAMEAAIPAPGSMVSIVVSVTADGATDAAPAIQTVLDNLPTSTQPLEIVVQGSTKGTIYINSKVRITTSDTTVRFAAPVLVGTAVDPDGFGGFSMLGSVQSTTTVSSGATRGSSVVVVASATNIVRGRLVRIYDNDTTGGGSAGNKAEMAEVVDVSGTTVYLDHALYQNYTGTISCEAVNAVTNSWFENIDATFSGQQTAGFLFTNKAQYTRRCGWRNCHFRGDPSNSWSRECFNTRYSYRGHYENCSASFGWDYAVGSTYDYGFTADGSTEMAYKGCHVSNTRHGFSADKGSAGHIYAQCWSDNSLASGFDLHGGWTRDITYIGCRADSSANTRSASDNSRFGFLSGNTTFINGTSNVTYAACVARGFGQYGSSGDGAGFGVVDGCSNIVFQSCRAYDCEQGVLILSQIGSPITNVGIYDCEFNNLTSVSAANLPIYVNAGVSPEDVNGLVIDGCRFVNGASLAAIRIYGTSGNTLGDITVTNNTWSSSPMTAGTFPIDARYVDRLNIVGNVFSRTRRGVMLTTCAGAAVTDNTFIALADGADAANVIRDGGANTNMVFLDNNLVGFTPTSWSVAITSTGAMVQVMTLNKVYTTAARPSAAIVRAGSWYYDTTLSKPAWSDGSVWKDAAGTTV